MAHDEDEPGMAIDINGMREDFTAPSHLQVGTVNDERSLADWVAVWLFPVPDDVQGRQFEALTLRGYADDVPWRYYVGRLGGKPVATSALFVDDGVAAVHHVVTLPEARHRGIGTAMTLHVPREARELGYRVGVLTSSPNGIGIYRQIGFREYCTFRRYGWGPDQGASTGG